MAGPCVNQQAKMTYLPEITCCNYEVGGSELAPIQGQTWEPIYIASFVEELKIRPNQEGE